MSYELLQLPLSTDSSRNSSHTTPPDHTSSKPPQPLQLGRLTNQLYQLHSSSTHSLSRVASENHPLETRRASTGPASTKSLHDLTEDTSLDQYTPPSLTITNGGKGSFRGLFLPPPIIPLPKTTTRNKKKTVSRSSSRARQSLREGESQSRTPTLHRQQSKSPHTLVSDSHTLKSDSRQSLGGIKSSSSLAVGDGSVSESTHSIREGEGEGDEGVQYRSKTVQKLLQKRAKFCTPGDSHTHTHTHTHHIHSCFT